MNKIVCTFLLFFAINADTTILETKVPPAYILSMVDKDSLVFFDIDFTILQPILFSFIHLPEWMETLISHFVAHSTQESMKSPFLKNIIESYILPFLAQIRKHLVFTPTDTCMVKLINELQKNRIPTFALTARLPAYNGYISYKQLKDIHVDFAKTALGKKRIKLTPPMLYNNGIIFTAGQDKGKAVKEFLQKTSVKPKKIILVDDFLRNITDVARTAEELKIPFVGIRYAYIEAN